VTLGPQTRRLSFLGFLLNHILHCTCFKILFTGSKYLVSNWSYTRLSRTIKKVKKSNKKFKICCVILILCNYHFIILNLFWAIKGFILYQIKQTALKSGYNFSTSNKFTDTSWIEELQKQKPLSLIWSVAQYLESDKWRVLSPCVTFVLGIFSRNVPSKQMGYFHKYIYTNIYVHCTAGESVTKWRNRILFCLLILTLIVAFSIRMRYP